ncbi:alpha-L-rhamnosidase N-terminal domain-containing protein, partial [Actinomadura adrarensis]
MITPPTWNEEDPCHYLSGVGLHHATVNGRQLTDEVLAPGNSNYQLSSEYRTYRLTDVLRGGGNSIGVELGNGPAYVRRSVTNPDVGRTSPYSWWQMVTFIDYIRREKVGTGANEHIVDAALADWVAADQTSGRITGTWGYHVMITKMAQMAELTGHTADAATYRQLATDIREAFNRAFYNESLGRYTSSGNAGTAGATQT